ncbi:hypothetical protein C8R45DRAFT_928472 [Mycena sanguinolenta]|nr:hypothetical protein C8R45DRAFT_928472 [Mycena sanguinolenta]
MKWCRACRASWWSAVKHILDSKTALSIVNGCKEVTHGGSIAATESATATVTACPISHWVASSGYRNDSIVPASLLPKSRKLENQASKKKKIQPGFVVRLSLESPTNGLVTRTHQEWVRGQDLLQVSRRNMKNTYLLNEAHTQSRCQLVLG